MNVSETVSELVLADWYLARDPGFATGSWSALSHYREKGWREGRAPNPHFDPGFYLAVCGGDQPAGDPLLDYVQHGEAAGRRPCELFDPAWYRRTYQVPSTENALAHFLRHRFTGAFNPSCQFDARFYLDTYRDVCDAGGDPLEHYHTRGRLEFRLPKSEIALIRESGLFDDEFYLFYYEDVRKAGAEPLDHFLHSTHEFRKPGLYFDPGWYRRRYGMEYRYSPLTHYLLVGENLGYFPCAHFDPVWYRRHYKLPIGSNALAHYLAHRKTQRYAPNASFDVLGYVTQMQSQIRPGRDPFFHYLATRSNAQKKA